MSFSALLQNLIHDTRDLSLPAWCPELILCATIVLLLAIRVPAWGRRVNVFYLALVGVGLALLATAPQYFLASTIDPTAKPAFVPREAVSALNHELFTGLVVYDQLTIFFRALLLTFTLLFILLTRLTGIPDVEEAPDFYTLVLGSVVGMMVMVSANHLLMVFLGIEMASVPAYALAGTLKGKKIASEAALKFAVYGAGAAGVMLYGISLLAGGLGSAHIPTLAMRLADVLAAGGAGDKLGVLALGGLMLMVGLAFKLSAVPFHFWAPDVFEGATAELGAFLSVASKAAALALLVRVAIGLGGEGLLREAAEPAPAAHEVAAAPTEPTAQHTVTLTANEPHAAEAHAAKAEKAAAKTPVSRVAALAPVRQYIVLVITLLAAITATFGNLAAFGQTNMKRLLAYSTIAHAGYMMMPVAAAVELMGDPSQQLAAQEAVGSLGLYIATYLFMNLGAFAIVAFLRNVLRSEEIADYAGLVQRSPGVAICFSIILFSLLGLPPLAGFAAKFAIFASLVNAQLWVLVVVGGLNTAISLIYYLRVVRVMTLEPEPAGRPPLKFPMLTQEGLYVLAMTVPVAGLLLAWEPLKQLTMAATSGLF